MSKPINRTEREVEPAYRNLIEIDHYFMPSWRERFKVLFGMNLKFYAQIWTVNRPGRFTVQARCHTTSEKPKKEDMGHAGPTPSALSPKKDK